MTATWKNYSALKNARQREKTNQFFYGSSHAFTQSSEQHRERQKQHSERNKEQYVG